MSERARGWLTGGLVLTLVVLTVVLVTVDRSAGADRAQQIETRLRCPTCKTVSIAESPSGTAAGMRRIVAEQVAQGRSDEQILAYFTARYGDWVVMDAPPKGATLPLWLLVVAALGLGAVVLASRTSKSGLRAAPLAPTERTEVQTALADYRHRDPEDQHEP